MTRVNGAGGQDGVLDQGRSVVEKNSGTQTRQESSVSLTCQVWLPKDNQKTGKLPGTQVRRLVPYGAQGQGQLARN